MGKAGTSSFTLALKLNTSEQDDRILNHRFRCAQQIYNTLVRYCIRQVSAMKADSLYRELMDSYMKNLPSGRKDKHVIDRLYDIRLRYDLSEYGLQAYVKPMQKKYKRDIDSMTAQKIASTVWRSVETVLFRKGKHIHFKSYHDMCSLEGKNNAAGIRYKNGRLVWNGLCISVQHDKKDVYEKLALMHRVKFCRIKRIPFHKGYHFYLELVLEGIPSAKHVINKGLTGIDIGTSTVAVYSDDGFCLLDELAGGVSRTEREKRVISRRMDRSRRVMNPLNYNEDGTVRKGRKKWNISNTYRRNRMKYKALCRKRAAAVKQSHEILANRILGHGDTVRVEKMSFAGLSRKTRKPERSKNGRYKRRRRFGSSIQTRAPAELIGIIDRKLGYIGKSVIKINTQTFKASRYDHVTDTYVKKKLSDRYTLIDGRRIQRDIYSAFLIMNSNDTNDRTDRQRCLAAFEQFSLMHDRCIRDRINSNRKYPSSMGLKYFSNL